MTDETFIRQKFEESLSRARETLRVREANRHKFLDRSRIGGVGDSCLAYATETGDCSISTAEFNRSLASYIPDSLEFISEEDLDSKAVKARAAALNELIDRAFLSSFRPDSSVPYFEPLAPDIRTDGHRVSNLAQLSVLLKAFPDIRVQVLAASDSAWLVARLEDSRSDLLPVTLPAWKLPDSALAKLAAARPGDWTPITRVPFGFLACIWLDPLPAPDILAKIQFMLARMEKQVDAEIRMEAIQSLQSRKARCTEEDTLRLSIRLAPPIRNHVRHNEPDWMRTHSAVLPGPLKSGVWAKFARGLPDSLGPTRSEFGSWTLSGFSQEAKAGKELDSLSCLIRVEAELRVGRNASLIRSEWDRMMSKKKGFPEGEIRSALLEELSKQGGAPEVSYPRLRKLWSAQSLRFTQPTDMLEALDEPPKSESRGAK